MLASIKLGKPMRINSRKKDHRGWRLVLQDPFETERNLADVIVSQMAQMHILEEFRRSVRVLSDSALADAKIKRLFSSKTQCVCLVCGLPGHFSMQRGEHCGAPFTSVHGPRDAVDGLGHSKTLLCLLSVCPVCGVFQKTSKNCRKHLQIRSV